MLGGREEEEEAGGFGWGPVPARRGRDFTAPFDNLSDTLEDMGQPVKPRDCLWTDTLRLSLF